MKINLRGSSAVLVVAACLTSSAHAQQKPADLDAVLRQMDAGSAKFKTAEADFRWDVYERVVKDTTTQTGTIYFQRAGKTTQMGAIIVPPSAKTIEYKNGLLRMFDPGSDQLTLMRAGGNQAKYESFLTLGFGGSGSDLAQKWTITDMGSEPLMDGKATVATRKLDLVAKDPEVLKIFKHITIWVDPVRDISLKQYFVTPDDDSRTVFNTNIRYNEKVDVKKFAIKTDGKTTTVEH